MSKLDVSTSLPASWNFVSLKELGGWSGGGTPSKAKPQYWQGGTIPWVSPKDMKTERISDSKDHITKEAVSHSAISLINAGSVLIVTRSGILRHTLPVAVNSVPVTVNQDLKALTPRDGIMAEYVAWALRAFSRDILHTCSKQGTTVNSVETSKLLSFEIPVAPTEQQRSIVAEIEKQFSRLDEAVANFKRVKANLKRYKAAVLKAAVEGKLTEDWRKRHPNVEPASKLLERILVERRAKWSGKGKYKEPTQFLEGDCPDLPANWAWASLDSIANVTDPNPSHRMPKYVDNGVPFISSENFSGSEDIDFTIGKEVPEKILKEQKDRYVIREGDFILTRIGTIGKTRFLPLPQTYCLSHALVIIQGLTSDIDRRYLRYVVASDATIQQAKLGVQSVGVPDLGMAKIRAFRIPLTCEAEQKEIVAEVERRLSVIHETEAQVDANLQRSERLRQSILAGMFSPTGKSESFHHNFVEPTRHRRVL